MKQYKRSSRLGEQMLREISRFYDAELSEGAPTLVTFTHVKLTDDLRQATVYYSCLGDEEHRESVELFLQNRHKKFKAAIGKTLRTRFIPELVFSFDKSIAEGIRIEKLLNDIKSDTEE